MKRIATITFHRAQNHGSVLQTYALKEFITKISQEKGYEIAYSVIDVSSKSQKELYKRYKKVHGINDAIKNAFSWIYRKMISERERKFSCFLNEYLQLTEYVEDSEALKSIDFADYYISGSDQIWNVRAKDFADFYMLDFVEKGKKISYSASFGPLNINWEQYDQGKYTQLLKDYSAISVREQGSLNNIKKLIGTDCEIHVDPTMLLDKQEWRKIQSDANYNNGKYILLYCLEPTKKQLEIARAISKKLKLPIMVLRYNNKNDILNDFVKKYDAGPRDFLSYIDHAALVLSSSFHGTVFSLIYHKPFYVFDGMSDNRISTILKKLEMESNSISSIKDVARVTFNIPDLEKLEDVLRQERDKSKNYLLEELELE